MAFRLRPVLCIVCLSFTALRVVSQESTFRQGQFVRYRGLDEQICHIATQIRFVAVQTELKCGEHCLSYVNCTSFFYNTVTDLCVVNELVFHYRIPGECEVSENNLYFYDISAGHCPEGYTWYSDGDYCYKLYSTCTTWQESRNQCLAEGGDLLMLKTAEEFNFFASMLQTNYDPNTKCSFLQPIWLGATDLITDDMWYWVDGTPANSHINGLWTSGEPSRGDHEDCLFMSGWDNWKYHDRGCDVTQASICAMQP